MLAIENLTKRFGPQLLFQGASFSLGHQERIGIVGPNGAGKSTFFKMLTGEEDADGGFVHIPNQYTIILMKQEWSPQGDDTVLNAALREFAPWFQARQKLQKLTENLDDHPETLAAYQAVETEFLSFGGYQVEYEVKEILFGLGFDEEKMTIPAKALSGGWRMRCYLAGLLIQKADLMLLDEPTNHLDIESVVWFEKFLQTYPYSYMMISHDRRLIEKTAKRILEFAPPKLTLWPGGLKKYESNKEVRMEQVQKEMVSKQREMDKLKDFARRFGAKASKARQAQSKMRSADSVEKDLALLKESMPIVASRQSQFSLELNRRQPKVCIEIEHAKFGYDQSKPLFYIDKCWVESGQKIGVIGENGVGKSTFLKTCAQEMKTLEGRVKPHSSCSISLFAQHRMEELPLSVKAIDYLVRESTNESITQIRGIAASLGLNEHDLDKPLEVLSGGEKARVSLSRILLQKPDILLLDEPTNHLDMEACDSLVKGLKSYTGTVLVISHNRDFLDALVDHIYWIGQGRVDVHIGNYSDYSDKVLGTPSESNEKKPAEKASKPKRSKEEKRLEAQARQAKSDELKNIKKELSQLETDMEKFEQELKNMDAFLVDPANMQSPEFSQTLKDRSRIEDKKELAEKKWLELQACLEQTA